MPFYLQYRPLIFLPYFSIKISRNSVNDVVIRLEEKNIPIAPKTVYGWESGQTQPDADTFLILCSIYKIDNILEVFGYQTLATEPLHLSADEKDLIQKYRLYHSLQPAIRKLLDIKEKY